MQPTHPAIPIMLYPARNGDRVTFKEWLKEVAIAKKGINSNLIIIDFSSIIPRLLCVKCLNN